MLAIEREVFANPDDNDARLVLADALQARGDPRGELIALQLRPDAVAHRERIAAILRDHGKTMLGPLRPIAMRAEFTRGFVSRLELAKRTSVDAATWDQLANEPLLGTVEDLLPGKLAADRYAQLVRSPAMTALRRIEVGGAPVIRALAETPARLVHVACVDMKKARYEERLAEVLPICERFAELQSFGVYSYGIEAVLRSPIAARLRTLIVGGETYRALREWPNLPRTLTYVITAWGVLPSCSPLDMGDSGSITLRYIKDAVHARVEGQWGFRTLRLNLLNFPKLASADLVAPPRGYAKDLGNRFPTHELPKPHRPPTVTGADT